MARALDFVEVDVFTDRVFGGNPLAVFLDGRGLSDDEMQAIAREMNLSETTFVLPATRPDCAARVRIFTPAAELPFAGHPTVGTAWVLATRGRPGGRARAAREEAGAYSRMSAPHPSRTAADPATGAASGPLGAYLVVHGLAHGTGALRLVSEQGTQMGRQSFVHIRLRADGGTAADIGVGGSVVPVLEGRLTIP